MPTQRKPLHEAGGIEEHSNGYRADVRARDTNGIEQLIRGPRRGNRTAAMSDLASIRAYGALFGDDRDGGLRAMRAEARRIQERVAFEHEIRAAMERQREEMTEDADPGPEEDVEDPDEWWRLLQDGGEQESYAPESILSQNYTHHCRLAA